MKTIWSIFSLISLLLGLVAAAAAQERKVKYAKSSEAITREQADAILNELRQIHLLLENQQKLALGRPQLPAMAQSVKLKIADDYSLGRGDAPLTMVEFTDYECSFCRQFHITTFEQLRKNYIDTGNLRFISRDLPLEIHPDAFRAAEAARCAGGQGQYWQMRDVLLANANNLTLDAILGYARALSLNVEALRVCIESGKYRAEVQKEIEDAKALDISGTPSFVLGRTSTDGVDGVRIVGAQPYAAFDARIRALLAKGE